MHQTNSRCQFVRLTQIWWLSQGFSSKKAAQAVNLNGFEFLGRKSGFRSKVELEGFTQTNTNDQRIYIHIHCHRAQGRIKSRRGIDLNVFNVHIERPVVL